MNREDLSEKVIQIISAHLDIEKEKIEENTDIYEDIGIDSIGMISLCARIQEEMKVRVSLAEIMEVRTIDKLCSLFEKAITSSPEA